MIRVGVIMGGDSSEREVSLMSGREFIKYLDKSKYQVVPVDITKPKDLLAYVDKIDVALLALHGKNGEDGKVQALLEALEIPYSGSGIVGSALCMDKNMSKLVLQTKQLLTPSWVLVKKNITLDVHYFEGLKMPVIVKPNQGGSSIGIQLVYDRNDILHAVEEAFKFDDEVIVESYIKGQEITCSMLNGNVIPVLSIQPTMTFFDFKDKYQDAGAIEEVVHLESELMEEVTRIAKQCWDIFNLKSYARIDMIISNSEIYLIEINTLPGMTQYSLLPKSAQAIGLSYGDILDQLINDALHHLG